MLARYNARRELNPFDIFTDLLWDDPFAFSSAYEAKSKPKTSESIVVDDAGVTLQVDLPGVRREDLTVETEGRTLFINARRGDKDMSRKFVIAKGYDPDQCDASLVDGVLTVKIAKEKTAETLRVKVEVK